MVLRADGQGLVRCNLIDEDGTVLMSSKGFDSVAAARAGAERARDLMAGVEVVDQTDGDRPIRSSPSVVDPGDRP